MPKTRAIILSSVVALWLATVICGMAMLWNYAMAPGDPGMAPRAWPTTTRIARNPSRLTLVMALHPHCPCSRASVGELARLMTGATGKLDAYVLFVQPAGFSAA